MKRQFSLGQNQLINIDRVNGRKVTVCDRACVTELSGLKGLNNIYDLFTLPVH